MGRKRERRGEHLLFYPPEATFMIGFRVLDPYCLILANTVSNNEYPR